MTNANYFCLAQRILLFDSFHPKKGTKTHRLTENERVADNVIGERKQYMNSFKMGR